MKFVIKSGLSLTVVGLVSAYGALEVQTQSAFAQAVKKGDRVTNTSRNSTQMRSSSIKVPTDKSLALQEVDIVKNQQVNPNTSDLSVPPTHVTPARVLVQTEPPSLAEANRLRQELKIQPLDPDAVGTANLNLPSASPSGGIPSGFGANLGDVYVGVYGATAGKARDNVDGSIAVGAGFGDSRKAIGLEATYNLTSIRNFASNGTFDLKVHRMIYESNRLQIAAAVGWTNFANYGTNAGGTPSSVYGVVTSAFLLRPEDPKYNVPVTVSAGVGGGIYRPQSLQNTSGGVGVFGSLGVQVHPQVSIGTGWTGQGLNFGLSFVPVPTIPLNINAIYSDVGNTSTAGSQFIFGLTYGFNFTPRF
jgi:hypothetical protein